MNETKTPTNGQNLAPIYMAWLAVAFFFCYQYMLRVAPGVMVQELRHDLHLTAEQFGTLGAYYLYAYAFLQIPLGLLMDAVGVRRTILGSIALCLVGAGLLAVSEELWMAQLSRILVGAGSASAFMGALKVVVDNLAPGQRGWFMGFTLTLGTMGAMVASSPLVLLVEATHWRTALWVAAAAGLLIFVAVWVFVPHTQRVAKTDQTPKHSLWSQIRDVLKNSRVMLYAVIAIGVYTPLSVIADLWGTAFLMQKFDMPRVEAAGLSILLFVGLAVGSFVLPWLCERYGILNRGIQMCCFGVLVVLSVILYSPTLPISLLCLALLALGLLCGSEMMCFTGAVLHTRADNSGITLGVVNTLNMLGGGLLQHLVGGVLDWQWTAAVDGAGIRVYSVDQYVYALSTLVGVVVVCCLLSLWLRGRDEA